MSRYFRYLLQACTVLFTVGMLVVPVSSVAALDAAGPHVFNNGTIQLSSETFAAMTTFAGPYLVNGQTLAFNTSAGSLTDAFARLLALNAGTVNTASGTLGTTTKIGSGTLTLSGANTYSGTTSLNAGKATLTSGAVLAGGSLTDVNRTINTIDAQGGTLCLDSGAFANTMSGSMDLSGSAVSLTKAGSGALTLEGTNTYSGTTSLNCGSVTLTGGALRASGTRTFNWGGNSTGVQDGTVNLSTGTTVTGLFGVDTTSTTAWAVSSAAGATMNLNHQYNSTRIQSGLLQLSGGQLVQRDPLSFTGAASSLDAIAGTICVSDNLSVGNATFEAQDACIPSVSALVLNGIQSGYVPLKINTQNAVTASASTLTLQASPKLVSFGNLEQGSVLDLSGTNLGTLQITHPITPILGNPLRITNENVAFAGTLNVGGGQVLSVNGNAPTSGDGGGTVVPEPSTLLLTLAALALAGLALLRRPGK